MYISAVYTVDSNIVQQTLENSVELKIKKAYNVKSWNFEHINLSVKEDW